MLKTYRKNPKVFKILACVAASLVLTLVYSYLEAYWLKITDYEIVSDDLPRNFNNTTIVFVSDIHHGPYFSLGRVTSLVDEVNSLAPDIIILGGDYIHLSPEYIAPVFRELSRLKPRFGVYAVLGNHDHWVNPALTRECIRNSNFQLCDNDSYWLRNGSDSIKIGGVGDYWEGIPIPGNVTADVSEGQFCIMALHNPDYLEELNGSKTDLTLSGHTHGGQITLFGLWAPVVPSDCGQKYRYGLLENRGLKSIITSGVGTIAPPLRLFCRPEIVRITLKTGNQHLLPGLNSL